MPFCGMGHIRGHPGWHLDRGPWDIHVTLWIAVGALILVHEQGWLLPIGKVLYLEVRDTIRVWGCWWCSWFWGNLNTTAPPPMTPDDITKFWCYICVKKRSLAVLAIFTPLFFSLWTCIFLNDPSMFIIQVICRKAVGVCANAFSSGATVSNFLKLMKDLGAPRDIPHELYGFFCGFQNKPSALVV